MTHIIFATRGIYASTQQMIADFVSQRFWWRRKNVKTGKVQDDIVQGILRPMILWEYIFPSENPIIPGDLKCKMEDNTQIVLRSMGIFNKDHYIPKSIGKYIKWIAKILGLKPIPDVEPNGPIRPIHQLGISIIPIGIKDDEYKVYDFGPAGKYEQEGL